MPLGRSVETMGKHRQTETNWTKRSNRVIIVTAGRRPGVAVSDHHRHAGWDAQSRLRRLIVPLVLVALAVSSGIVWALAHTSDRGRVTSSRVTSSTAVTAGPTGPTAAPPTAASTTAATITPTTTAVPTRSTRTSSTPTTRSPSVRLPRSTPLLQQTMARPKGVAALMDLDSGAGGADGDCYAYPEEQRPTIAIGEPGGPHPSVTGLRIGTPLTICLLGFSPDAAIEVTVESPDGSADHLTAPAPDCPSGCYSWTGWAALPGASLGRYDVAAVQGNLSAKGAITVLPADEPSLMVLDSPGGLTRLTVRPGTTIGIVLAGFGPYQSIGLLFYYTPSFEVGGGEHSVTGLRFRGSTTVTTNGRGTTFFRLETSPTDLPGCYAVNTWPPLVALQRHLNPPYPSEVWISHHNWEQFCLQR
jgi:hypothetical protein